MTFAFSHTWRVNAAPDVVFDVLADVDGYPRWWPQVKSVERIDESSGRAIVRSLLPYRLHLVMTREIEDRESGVLRVRLAEDLIGFAQFTVRGLGTPSALGSLGRSRSITARWSRSARRRCVGYRASWPPFCARTTPR